MTRFFKKAADKIGLKPGTLVYVGKKRTEKPTMSCFTYTEQELAEQAAAAVDECLAVKDKPGMSWIDVDGIHEISLVEKIGSHFGLHPLLLEDIVNSGHRPKLELGDDHAVVILKMLRVDDDLRLCSEQVSIAFGSHWVLTFQEETGDVFDPVRQRLRRTVPRVRFMHASYLAYALMDAIVDNYFVVLERVGEEIELLEDSITENATTETLQRIQELRRELIFLRRAVWPLREAIGGLERIETDLISDATRPYLRDLYEHTIQVIDTVETFRDMVSGLLDLYMSSVSNRMNEIMKVLTIIATIFIPLGFLAGVYGMNFDTSASPFNLPELGFEYGYPLFWVVALLIAGGLFWFFRRRGWL